MPREPFWSQEFNIIDIRKTPFNFSYISVYYALRKQHNDTYTFLYLWIYTNLYLWKIAENIKIIKYQK